jgi:hypothetical protein
VPRFSRYMHKQIPESHIRAICDAQEERLNVSREVRFKKQHKPIGFGDKPDPDTVKGHLNDTYVHW